MAKSTSKSRVNTGADVAMPYKSAEERTNGPFDGYEVRSALETLTRALKIRRNRALMKEVRKEAGRQLKAAQGTVSTLNGAK